MATQPQQQKAIIPDWHRDPQAVDKMGNWISEVALFFQQLILALQTNLKPEGFVIPPQTASNIGVLTGQPSQNNILYDSTNNAFNGNIINNASGAQAWIPFAMITTFAGNPNTHVAGNVTWLCLDTTNKILYVCTLAGNAASAQWTAT